MVYSEGRSQWRCYQSIRNIQECYDSNNNNKSTSHFIAQKLVWKIEFRFAEIAISWMCFFCFVWLPVDEAYCVSSYCEAHTSSSHSFAIYNCVAYNIGMWIQHNFRFHSIYCLALPNEWWMYRLPPGRWFIWMLNDDSVEWATWVPRLTISTLTLYYSSRLWSKLSFGTVTSIYLFYWYKYYYVAPWRVSLVWPRSMWSAHIGSKCTEHI